jgi:uncharacterized protein (TIGR02118 family)
MVKLVLLYGFPKDQKAFEDYYYNQHLPFAQQKMHNVRQAEMGKVVGTPDGSPPPYYRIAQMSYDSLQDLQASIDSGDGQAALADLAHFATGGVTIFLTEEG